MSDGVFIVSTASGDATLVPGCSQEHLELKKKNIYIIINFFYLFTLKKKIGTLSIKIRNTLK